MNDMLPIEVLPEDDERLSYFISKYGLFKDEDDIDGAPEDQDLFENGDLNTFMMRSLCTALAEESYDFFSAMVMTFKDDVTTYAEDPSETIELILMGLKQGAFFFSDDCAYVLGLLYYEGELVEQDCKRAEELYKYASNNNNMDATLALGAMYEQGVLGEVDYDKAFKCYALATLIEDNSEAYYKLGDLYYDGHGVEMNQERAHMLYQKSYDLAEDEQESSHPALRLANMYLNEDAEELFNIDYNPIEALKYYQIAEVGLHLELLDGNFDHVDELKFALDGQKNAREALMSLVEE